MNYVLYHSKCYDGFGAAYAAWKKIGDVARYVPVSYGYPPPEMPEATEIYILDFSYKQVELFELAKTAKVVVLDHHKTALQELAPIMGAHPNLQITFREDQSGALMAWNYFHAPKPAPALIEHISDRDLWHFKLEGTREIHRALVSLPMVFPLWETLDVEQLKVEGRICGRVYDQLVDNIVETAWMGKVDGHEVPIVNTSIAWSEVGHKLCFDHPEAPFAASFTVFNDQVMWSLRSRGEFDVSAIAKKFGGGGHKNAAGFKTARF